jgi:hypothetical protein
MTYSPPTPEAQIAFLENIQTLLAEGQFTATYKFALLIALADLAVEMGDDSGRPVEIPTRRIAEKFIEYYWNQTLPWAPAGREAKAGILAQNTGKPAEVLQRVLEVREWVSEYQVDARRNPAKWRTLVSEVNRVVKTMPLWKLQVLPGRVLDFLYENVRHGDSVTLRPGVAFNLRRYHPLVNGQARAAWADFVRKLRANQPLLGQATDLHSFLFGKERTDLSQFRALLHELQDGKCFYCSRPLQRGAPVDHLVPWSRYPVDLAHNFVLADAACNSHKSDFLPDVPFLERWVRRNDDHCADLANGFARVHAPHDLGVSIQITAWAYHQVERSGGSVWAGDRLYRPLEGRWREILHDFR